MCIGVPMQVEALSEDRALCRDRRGQTHQIDIRLVDGVSVGGWVLTFLEAAREVLSADEARLIGDALDAAVLVQQGANIDHLFADLLDREPQLPDHLRPQS